MKTRHIALLSLLWPVSSLWAQSISQPAAREGVLADLGTIGVADSAKVQAEPAKDPFNPPAADLREAPAPGREGEATRRSDAELPALLAARVRPTGSMTLGGEPYLLFTERRQKIGDKVSVTLDGVEYAVEIVSIAGNRFRIRYNGKEAERTIK